MMSPFPGVTLAFLLIREAEVIRPNEHAIKVGKEQNPLYLSPVAALEPRRVK
jgi:hypothetical protein